MSIRKAWAGWTAAGLVTAGVVAVAWTAWRRPEYSQAEAVARTVEASFAQVAGSAASAAPSGWPCLFGPTRNSVSAETGLHIDWEESGPREKWRIAIGDGYSVPALLGDDLVLFHRVADDEVVECLDAESGQTRWSFRYPTAYQCIYEYSHGPAGTPSLEAGRCYTLGAEGKLHCLNLADGNPVWSRDLKKDYEIPDLWFGVGCSPLIEGDRIILNAGGQKPNSGIVALDKMTGETLWTSTEHDASYATAIGATIHGRRHVFLLTGVGLTSVGPADGQVHWEIPFRSKIPDSPNATSPLVYEDKILVSMGNGLGSLCVRVLPDGSYEELWKNRRVLDSQWNNLTCIDGHVYGFASTREAGKTFRCVELATGKLKWTYPSNLRRGALLAASGRFILLGEYGHLAAVEINPFEAIEVAKTAEPLLEQPCYTMPALHRGLLYLRNQKELICYDLRAAETLAASEER